MKENNDDILIIKQSYEEKFHFKYSDDDAKELLRLGNNDVVMILKTIETTERHYKLNEFVEANAKKKVEHKEQQKKKKSAYVHQLEWMYEPFLDDKTIDQTQYNAIIAQRQGLPYNLHDYQQGMFYIQKQMYKHPRQWVYGLGLTRWEEQAFAALVPEQQEHFNIDLIRKAGIQYEKDFVPDADITPLAIRKMFGMQRIEINGTR